MGNEKSLNPLPVLKMRQTMRYFNSFLTWNISSNAHLMSHVPLISCLFPFNLSFPSPRRHPLRGFSNEKPREHHFSLFDMINDALCMTPYFTNQLWGTAPPQKWKMTELSTNQMSFVSNPQTGVTIKISVGKTGYANGLYHS